MFVGVRVGPSPFCTVTLGFAPAPLLRKRLLTRASGVPPAWCRVSYFTVVIFSFPFSVCLLKRRSCGREDYSRASRDPVDFRFCGSCDGRRRHTSSQRRLGCRACSATTGP